MISRRHSYFLNENWNIVVVFLVLVLLVWVTDFWYFTSFGLYEDDWNRIPLVMTNNAQDLWNLISESFMPGASQGRPFHPIFIFLFSFLGLKLGGLHSIYWIGSVVITINAFLFYALLRRAFENQSFALLGALAFCLFPADTTRPFLTHSLGLQPSITFLLIAFHVYLSEKIKLSYLMVLVTLFTYETVFPVFIVAPLFKQTWDSRTKKELFRHGLVLIGMLAFVILLRKATGEGRVSNFSTLEFLLLIGNPIVGPLLSIILYIYRPIEALFKLNRELLILLSLCFLGFTWILSQQNFNQAVNSSQRSLEFKGKLAFLTKLFAPFQNYAKPIVLGLTMLILAYPLTLTTLGFAVSGRGTRAHTAAVLGASLLCASVCSIVLSTLATQGHKRLATLGLAGIFTFLIGFGLIVQQDYKLGWQHQRAFWTDVVKLCPDLADGDVIFVEPTGLRDTRQLLFLRKTLTGVPDTRQIKSLETLYVVLPKIYQFPGSWRNVPRVYRLPMDWQEKIVSDDGSLQTLTIEEGYTYEAYTQRTVESSKVIFLETKNGQLTRRTAPLVMVGKEFPLKTRTAAETPKFERGPVYGYLIRNANEGPVDYLVKTGT
jgi:hypothetical protein